MEPHIWGRGAWLIIFAYIYNSFSSPSTNDQYRETVETTKKFLYLFCKNLPCTQCATNAIAHITENSIMSASDPNIILHFFIELYNVFHQSDKMDRSAIKTFPLYINDW